ncbi:MULTISPECIES: 4-hydroxy-tetrahydrodipicolinate synthase [Geobacillus]|uniref:4-hydroxy-tetrahydrodipicolinate synthase n=1 Tax=Geobacillus thermodenitrificans TaxID=33940 RepID=A0ABY9QFX6_GEOTD|nr:MULTISPECIES: 4-hydroxy-tetrahydrodipicolinate synthase [Geobacillus]NNU86070.1 4-hydroxy-tetrahydrodipicolinate synthase [Geobacillus sp. MR]ARA97112.1 4-hydroxy-tetrahydrodipicolinate synthase [Geobacillus thermodenitrificans]ARP42264.1 4-hydroxy-tetrahydrodipicolinate synthase [Geobacillus thermodenitrificans]ATO36395.1 4-hydroxy-tetrahydrodipicolinate synthase [Geobacillus thermodenitrificans]KQB93901.1 4-hydroxy-tetrahydrodipicolinate synthase [Geobacillus sp. PA-3]
MAQFGNIVTAMVTPFDRKGNLDLAKTTELVNYLLDNGTDALVVAGTTGESPTLTAEEKVALFRHVVNVVNGRVPVIAGTGTNDTRASIELTKRAEETGVDAVMLVAPYYNKPNQEGLYQHFKAIAESTSLPVMLYNVPGRTSVNLAPETVIRLAAIPNIVAVKEAGGNLDAMAEIIEQTPDDFLLYSGDDSLTLPVLAIGGAGVVSVASHIIGNEMQQMIRAFQAGDHQKAAALHRKWVPLMKGLFAAPSPVPVKTALQLRGLDVGPVRLPLVPLTEQERSELSRLLSALS